MTSFAFTNKPKIKMRSTEVKEWYNRITREFFPKNTRDFVKTPSFWLTLLENPIMINVPSNQPIKKIKGLA